MKTDQKIQLEDDIERQEFRAVQKTFTHRQYPTIQVLRKKDSHGACSILIYFGSQKLAIENEDDSIGDHYEMMARALCEVLDEATDDTCKL